MGKGRFITFEGVEGSGKSLQLGLLCTALKQRGVDFVQTLEPGGTPFGQEVRRLLLQADGADREPVPELLLYLADRFQHLQTVIEPALSRGMTVLCDRYHDATLAYQGFARGIGLSRIEELARVLDIRAPDLTLLFDLDVRRGLDRARRRNHETASENQGRFEAEHVSFHQRVREGYLELARRHPTRIVTLDADRPVEVIHQEVLEIWERQL